MIEQSKEAYYLALRQTQGTVRTDAPNWQPCVMFFLRALRQQMNRLAKKVEREKIVLAALPELSARIIEHTREHGRVTISDIVRLTGTSRNTLKQHFRQLVAEDRLALHGSGRGAWLCIAVRKGLLGIVGGDRGSEDFYRCVDFNERIGGNS